MLNTTTLRAKVQECFELNADISMLRMTDIWP